MQIPRQVNPGARLSPEIGGV